MVLRRIAVLQESGWPLTVSTGQLSIFTPEDPARTWAGPEFVMLLLSIETALVSAMSMAYWNSWVVSPAAPIIWLPLIIVLAVPFNVNPLGVATELRSKSMLP